MKLGLYDCDLKHISQTILEWFAKKQKVHPGLTANFPTVPTVLRVYDENKCKQARMQIY